MELRIYFILLVMNAYNNKQFEIYIDEQFNMCMRLIIEIV